MSFLYVVKFLLVDVDWTEEGIREFCWCPQMGVREIREYHRWEYMGI